MSQIQNKITKRSDQESMKSSHLFQILIGLICLLLPPGSTTRVYAADAYPPQSVIEASVQRVTTVQVLPYLPFQTFTAHFQEVYSGGLGTSFAYDIGYFGMEQISNLVYSANAGVTCQLNEDLIIVCSGPLSHVTINFDYTAIADSYSGQSIWWGFIGNSNYSLDYTFNLIYPAPLVYVRSYSLEPTTITSTQITWQKSNTLSLPGVALFQDPRVYVLYLPLVQRGQ